jgi:hypothetical protein
VVLFFRCWFWFLNKKPKPASVDNLLDLKTVRGIIIYTFRKGEIQENMALISHLHFRKAEIP